MNWFLSFLIIVLFAGGYYGYTTLQGRLDADEQQIGELRLKASNYDTETKRLGDEYADAKQEVAHMRMTLVDLQQQAGTAPKATAPPAMGTPPPAPPKPPPPLSNHLGTITASDGKSYRDCKLLKVEATGIVFSHADGIMELAYSQLPAELKTRFGYDPTKGPALTDDQVAALEQQRLAAEAATP
jgi:hypothetical protein